MPQKLLHYKGPYGEQRNPVSNELIDYEPLKKRSAIYNYENKSTFDFRWELLEKVAVVLHDIIEVKRAEKKIE